MKVHGMQQSCDTVCDMDCFFFVVIRIEEGQAHLSSPPTDRAEDSSRGGGWGGGGTALSNLFKPRGSNSCLLPVEGAAAATAVRRIQQVNTTSGFGGEA